MSSVQLHFQDVHTESSSMLETVLESFEGATEGGAIFAWTNVSGSKSLIDDKIFRAFVKNYPFSLIVGLDSITDEKAVKFLIGRHNSLDNLTVRAFLNDSQPLFHPKMAWFTGPDRTRLIVGSANLTMGGLKNNWEAYTVSDVPAVESGEVRAQISNWTTAWSHLLLPIADPRVLARALKNVGNERTLKRAPRSVPEGIAARPALEVLVSEIPKSGDRGSQANFTKENYEGFFGTPVGMQRRITLYRVDASGALGDLESRPSVARESKNYSFELAALRGVDYPASGRPVGIFLALEADTFLYMLVLPGEPGYPAIDSFLSMNWTGRADHARRVRTSVSELQAAWPSSPLWKAPLPAL